jgi:hypothetical protein
MSTIHCRQYRCYVRPIVSVPIRDSIEAPWKPDLARNSVGLQPRKPNASALLRGSWALANIRLMRRDALHNNVGLVMYFQ